MRVLAAMVAAEVFLLKTTRRLLFFQFDDNIQMILVPNNAHGIQADDQILDCETDCQ